MAATAGVTAGPMPLRSTRAGRVLSAKSRDLIQTALDHLGNGRHTLASETLQQLLVTPDTTDEEESLDEALDRYPQQPARVRLSLADATRQLAERVDGYDAQASRRRRLALLERANRNDFDAVNYRLPRTGTS